MSTKKNAISTESYKGVRDFYPADMSAQNFIFKTMRTVAERFGYVEYSASLLEPAELYRSKTSEEIVNEQTYTFTDRGDREVTLRPEMTPTVARMIAGKRNELAFPLRWYSLPNLFRYERPQRGRLREHWQLNADLFGISDNEAEIEIISLAYALMKEFGAKDTDFEIRINDRVLLNERFGKKELIQLLDKKDKMSRESFEEKWKSISGTLPETDIAPNETIKKVIEVLKARGISNTVFTPTLTRGFDYYTGIVFEVFDTSPENNRALFGGGRYDNLLELFDEKPIPAVGFGMGDVTMRDFLETRGLLPPYRSTTDLYVIPIEKTDLLDAQRVAELLRKDGLNVAVDFSDKKVGEKIKTADKKSIPFALFVGKEETEENAYTLKNLRTHEEKKLSPKEIADTTRK